MLDMKIVRQDPEKIRKMLKDRAVQFDLDLLLQLDEKRRELIISTDSLRNKKNEMSIKISDAKKAGKDASSQIQEMQSAGQELAKLEEIQHKTKADYEKLAFTLPNLLHESVPIGHDDSANKEIFKWGEVPKFDFEIKGHEELAKNLGILDLERAAKTAGARFYYLKGELVKLGYAITAFALDFLSIHEKGYNLIQPPYMINRDSMAGTIITDDFEEAIYKVENQDLFLIGTSEHAIASMYGKEILDGKNLPFRYGSISPCFRKEAGAHGKDQKGIFRVHQFEKVEQFIFSKPEDSWKLQEEILENAKELYRQLEIPYRVVLLSSGDMGKVSARTFDIEAWMAEQNTYREIGSVSNCLDYQARRLKIRFRDKTNEGTQYVHTLNGTLVAIERTMVAIMENNQTKDGHIRIPTVLQKYFGQKVI
uniref:Serine--tRNA ligase n=1 Tax=uncultured marine thaumarchaeote KM3_76_A03 TaxID=1456281 RepID=A0A075HKX1_9ARCH|nr:seryl-tRNA synthetase (SARS, serS) [uncultured marine thaumarchaeote KM3_76_A03]